MWGRYFEWFSYFGLERLELAFYGGTFALKLDELRAIVNKLFYPKDLKDCWIFVLLLGTTNWHARCGHHIYRLRWRFAQPVEQMQRQSRTFVDTVRWRLTRRMGWGVFEWLKESTVYVCWRFVWDDEHLFEIASLSSSSSSVLVCGQITYVRPQLPTP